MLTIKKSNKLNDVCYDIRGPVLKEAKRLEEEGFHIYKLSRDFYQRTGRRNYAWLSNITFDAV